MTYPVLHITISSDDDGLFFPQGCGTVTQNLLGVKQERNDMYPSINASCPYMACYHIQARRGIYYGAHDRLAAAKRIAYTVEPNGTASDLLFSIDVPAMDLTHPQNSQTLNGRLVWALFDGDWYDAAQIYRAFVLAEADWLPSFGRPDVPRWMRETPLWFSGGVENVLKASEEIGVPAALHLYCWHKIPFDNDYPHYFPARDTAAAEIAALQERGIHVMPYINGRLWDPSTESYGPRNGKDASCRRPDGNLYTEIYPTSQVPNTVTCPASPIWHDVIMELADRIQDELGTNGLYIDQIAAAAPYPCYAKNHNHPAGGGEFWYHSYRDMMRDLRKDHLRPGNIVFSEENAECYIPSFDVLLTVNTPHSPDCRIVPLYPMIYSDRVITVAFTYSPYTDVRNGDFRYENMQCLLYGAQLGWVDPRLLWVDDKSAYEAEFLKNLVEFRKNQHDVFLGGRYIREFIPEGDNPIAEVPVFGPDYMVKGAEWVSPSGQRVLYVVNSDSKPHTVKLPTGKTITLKPISAERINIK